MEKAVPHILQSSAKKLKVKNTELFKTKRFYGKILSFNEYLGFPCYHTTWQYVAPTISTTEMLKRKGNAGVKIRSTKKPVSALQL